MSSEHDPCTRRAHAQGVLRGATGALLAVSVLGAGVASVAAVPGTAATGTKTTTAATGASSTGTTTSVAAATASAPVASSHGS